MGAIIIGRMKMVRNTPMPRSLRSSSSASPTPMNISSPTTMAAKEIVTMKLSWKFGSLARLM